MKALNFAFPVITNTVQKHYFLLSYNAFSKASVIHLGLFFPVRAVQVKNLCKCKKKKCQLLVHGLLYNIHSKVTRIASVIHPFLAKQSHFYDVIEIDVNVIFERF